MHRLPLLKLAIAVSAALVALVGSTGPALAWTRDTTPPTSPFLSYAEGYYCGVIIVGMTRVTDNVTPQDQLRYQVFVDGAPFGPTLVDTGSYSGVWAWFQPSTGGPTLSPGQHYVFVKARDAAGNWSAPSRSWPVTGFPC